jgi:hypothetical protein
VFTPRPFHVPKLDVGWTSTPIGNTSSNACCGGAPLTVTLTYAHAVPPSPRHFTVYDADVCGDTLSLRLSFGGVGPLHPGPDLVHDTAFVLVQAMVVAEPALTNAG